MDDSKSGRAKDKVRSDELSSLCALIRAGGLPGSASGHRLTTLMSSVEKGRPEQSWHWVEGSQKRKDQ